MTDDEKQINGFLIGLMVEIKINAPMCTEW